MLIRESIYESIRHLPGRTEEELKAILKGTSPFEKIKEGAKQNIVWLIEEALEEGANEFAIDEALLWAAFRGNNEIVKLLLDSGADIHYQKDHALYWAVRCENFKTVKLLLKRGATITRVILDTAKASTDEIKRLIEQKYNNGGKKVNESIKHLPGRTPKELKSYLLGLNTLEKFEEGCTNGILWAVKEALKENPDMHNASPETYGHGFANAAWNNHLDIIKFLAKKPVHDDFYRTYAICAATANGYLDILKYLIEELNYDPALATSKKVVFSTDKNHDYSPIWTAANDGFIDIIKYLISFKSVRKAISEYEAEQIAIRSGIPFGDIIAS